MASSTFLDADGLNTFYQAVKAQIEAGPNPINAPNIYSTEEVRIGTWIDGKPLYRKCYEATTPANSGDGVILTVDSTMFVQNFQTRLHNSSLAPNCFMIGSIMASTPYNIMYWFRNDAHQLWVRTTGYLNMKVLAILEYTKTTDVATNTVLSEAASFTTQNAIPSAAATVSLEG